MSLFSCQNLKCHSVGLWSSLFSFLHNLKRIFPKKFEGFYGQEIKVGTIEYAPWSYLKSGEASINGTYVGIAINHMHQIASLLNFTYSFYHSVDFQYGSQEPNGSWNGLVGLVIRGQVDAVVTGLTISKERATVVDFTYPYFMETFGIEVAPDVSGNTKLFTTFAWQVWIIYITLSVVLTTVLSMTAIVLSSNQSLHDIALFSFGALWRQGGILNWSANSQRCIVASCWLVIVIVSSQYSGTLIASLSTSQVKLPFETLEGLASHPTIHPIVKKGTVQEMVFKNAERGIYSRIGKKLVLGTSIQSFTPSEMKQGSYAHISDYFGMMDNAARNNICDYIMLPERFFPSGFGLAIPKNSPFNTKFSTIIQNSLGAGLDVRWMKEHAKPYVCDQIMKRSPNTSVIQLPVLQPLFLLLFVGILISTIVLMVERKNINCTRRH